MTGSSSSFGSRNQPTPPPQSDIPGQTNPSSPSTPIGGPNDIAVELCSPSTSDANGLYNGSFTSVSCTVTPLPPKRAHMEVRIT